jgi:hypothetical protein
MTNHRKEKGPLSSWLKNFRMQTRSREERVSWIRERRKQTQEGDMFAPLEKNKTLPPTNICGRTNK